LTPAEIANCLAGLRRLEVELGSPVAEADIKWRSHAYALSPWFKDLIRHSRLLDAIEDVIGPDILVWTSTFFIGPPRNAGLEAGDTKPLASDKELVFESRHVGWPFPREIGG